MSTEDTAASGDAMMRLVMAAQRMLLQQANGEAMNQQAHAAIEQATLDIKTSEALLQEAKAERESLATQAERRGFRIDFILSVAERAVSSMVQSGLDPSMVQPPSLRRKPGRPSLKPREDMRMAVPASALLKAYLPEDADQPVQKANTAPVLHTFSSMIEDKVPDLANVPPARQEAHIAAEALVSEMEASPLSPITIVPSAPVQKTGPKPRTIEAAASVEAPLTVVSELPSAVEAVQVALDERTPEQIEADAALSSLFPQDASFDLPAAAAVPKPAAKRAPTMGM